MVLLKKPKRNNILLFLTLLLNKFLLKMLQLMFSWVFINYYLEIFNLRFIIEKINQQYSLFNPVYGS